MAMTAAGVGIASAGPPPGLPFNASELEDWFPPVFDYDGDGCYPTPAVGPDGTLNGGLHPSGALHGQCHDQSDLDTANMYARAKCNNGWCGVGYALYFEKDQAVKGIPEGGHRHDWEHVVVWFEPGGSEVKFVAISGHGGMEVKPRAEVPFLDDAHPKIVYHKDGFKTHALRFAKADEAPENLSGKWHSPATVGFNGFPSEEIRNKMYYANWGSANIDLNDVKWNDLLNKSKPAEIPFDAYAAE